MTGLTIRRLTSLKYKLFVTSVAVFALVAQPLYGAISAQVANAVAGSVSSVDASYVKEPAYTGIYVGFDTENIASAKSVELRVNRTNGETPYSIFAQSSVLTAINNAPAKYSTGGTVIVTGSRTSASWTPQTGTWTGTSKPVSVDVIVTLENNTELKSSDLTIRDNGATIDQVMPLPPADTTAPAVTSISQAYEEKEGGRIAVTLSFDEALNPSSLGQGWSEVAGSNKTKFIKRYYATKEHTVTFNDVANNQGSYIFTVDKTAPTVLQATQAFENHASGPRVNVTLTFSEAITPASLPQGWYEVAGSNKTKYVKAFYSTKTHIVNFTDLTGNAGTFTLSVDATIPAAPVLSLGTTQGTPLTTGGFTNKSDVVATWTKPTGDIAKYEYAYWNNIPSSQYNTEDKAWTTDVAGITRSGAFDQGEGTHYMKVRAYSPSGNTSNWSNVFEVTYDKTLPANFAIKLADGRDAQDTTIGGAQTFTFTQTEANPKNIYIEYMEKNSNGNWAKKLGKEVLGTNAAALTVDTSTWREGAHQVKVTTKDAAGNATSTNAQFIVDNTLPSIAVKDGFKGNKTERVFREVSFSLYDAHMADKYMINQHVSDFTNNKWSDANFQNIKQYLVQGENTLKLYDVAGNVAIYKFTYDTVAPQTPIHNTPFDGAAQKSNDFWFEWNDVEDAVSYEMQNSQNPETGNNGSFTQVQWTGDYQQIQPTESKARSIGVNGTWYWQVRAVDAAGNKSPWTTSWKITIDQQAPVAVSASVQGPVKSLDGTTKLSMTLQDESTNIVSAKYTLYDDETDEAIKKNVSIAGAYDNSVIDLSTDIDVSTLPTGQYRVQLHFNDAAGNQGKRTLYFTVNNNVIVEVTSIQANTSTPTIAGTAHWDVDDEPLSNTEITVVVGDRQYPVSTNSIGNWSFVVSPALAVGTHAVTVALPFTLSTPAQVTVAAPSVPGDNGTGGNSSGGQDTGSSTPQVGNNIPQTTIASNSTPISTLLPAASLFSAAAPLLAPGTTPTATDDNDNTVASVQGLSTANSNESDDTEGEVKAAEDTKASWSLGNLVLTAISVIAGLMALLGVFRKRETDEVTHTALRAIVIVVAAGTAIAYVLTNDFAAPMAWFSMWSIAYAVAVIAQVSIIANLKGSAE